MLQTVQMLWGVRAVSVLSLYLADAIYNFQVTENY